MVLDYVGTDVPVRFGDSRLKQWSYYSTLCPVGPVLHTFVQYLISFCSRLEAASDVVSSRFLWSIVPDKCVKFCDPCLNRSREMPPDAVEGKR